MGSRHLRTPQHRQCRLQCLLLGMVLQLLAACCFALVQVSGGVAAEVEGAPKYVMQPEMEEQGEAEWGPAEELDGSEDTFLLSAEVLPSSEDFPQSRQVGWRGF